jgi:benzoyl-CoA reductase/2-hydroxyglutaryl-CoA dehydratase subunit BcrC/BadD/HgdB
VGYKLAERFLLSTYSAILNREAAGEARMEEILKQSAVIENQHVRQWKRAGGRVVGYICLATPPELMEAAGLLPYRVRALGYSRTELADAHLSRFNCSFCRSCLQLGLTGAYDFLDGIIETNGCDHLRGMIENWRYVKPFDFFHYLKVPHLADPDALKYYEEELRLYAQALAGHFHHPVTEAELWSQMQRQGRIRARLRALYELRERAEPAVTGAEALAIFLAATAAPAAVAEGLLDRVLEQRKDRKLPGFRARLLLAGSATDEIAFVKGIEDMGGLVVTDALCYGARAFWPVADEPNGGDPYPVLARTYLEKLLCPRMFQDFPARRDFILTAVARAKVDGVVLVHNKFCDIHGVDNVALRLALEKKGIPVLQLEKEYGAAADLGRLKTRVQAFLERIGGRQ